LPAPERAVFVLHYVEQRTLSEIAEWGGYSLATAKRKVRRASDHFRVLWSRDRGRRDAKGDFDQPRS
jgi:DNA-directed RNA polymerase specialized sigma24 family protein